MWREGLMDTPYPIAVHRNQSVVSLRLNTSRFDDNFLYSSIIFGVRQEINVDWVKFHSPAQSERASLSTTSYY